MGTRRISGRRSAMLAVLLGFALAQMIAAGFPPQHPAASAAQKPPGVSDTFSSGAQIHPPPADQTFPVGQVARYSGEWHLMTAGTATLAMHSAGANHTSVMTADSAGVVNMLYPVHDRLESSFDPRTFCSVTLKKHAEEGSRRRESLVHFDYEQGKSVVEEKDLRSGQVKHATHSIPRCVTDVISGFYYMASLPLKPGTVYTFPINDGGETSEVTARVELAEQLNVPAGTYKTVRVAVQAMSGPLNGKGKLWAWYSDDRQHLLVQMKAKVKWGALSFRLTRVERQ